MSISLQRSLCQMARSFHTTSQVQKRAWIAENIPRYLGQTNMPANTTTERIKQAVFTVNTDARTCLFKASLQDRLRIYTSTYHGTASPRIYQLRATAIDSDRKNTVLIFKDRRATYVYPTPLDFSPHNETPPLVKKITSVVLTCSEEYELEFSERQAPDLPLPFLEEIQRLIQKSR
ncbi:MAG: hypothetical protein NTX49_08300 [Chlamydiae bacterium]|nr:hypothetical protein [Chlamydiota bacterium]